MERRNNSPLGKLLGIVLVLAIIKGFTTTVPNKYYKPESADTKIVQAESDSFTEGLQAEENSEIADENTEGISLQQQNEEEIYEEYVEEDTLNSDNADNEPPVTMIERNPESLRITPTEDTYLKNAVDSSGKIIRWKKSDVDVFIESGIYYDEVQKVVEVYQGILSGRLKFTIVQDRKTADIVVRFVDRIGAGGETYIAGLTSNSKSGDGAILSSDVKLLTKKPLINKPVSEEEMYMVALHEFGHAIGIEGHSQDEGDVMFASQQGHTELSQKDIDTINLVYSDNLLKQKQELYGFAEDKLQEAEDYARIFSDKPIAWTNLAGLYYERKELNKALDAYKEALKLDAYDSNTYAAMAQCYYRSAKYDVAYKYYDYAYQYSNDYQTKMQFRYMLGVCDIALGDFDEAYEFLKEVNTYDSSNKQYLYAFLHVCSKLNKKYIGARAAKAYLYNCPDDANDKNILSYLKWAES